MFFWLQPSAGGTAQWNLSVCHGASGPCLCCTSYTVYQYDHRNRLVSVTDFNASDVKHQQVAYTYDLFKRLIGRELDDSGECRSASGRRERRVWLRFRFLEAYAW
ncbi:hypothetical protein DTL42_17940 [Bremerella cremea]|uniref:Uncharacterized protein n=1 Tax=Bremerella cremea TaxID=1031537 RepID=A0A368KRK3_9BACT|nr:hypothetical protein [Bremerella cremea]RCS44193.1 hypothetical protein DTL42_17940 [Bremerella cremea]